MSTAQLRTMLDDRAQVVPLTVDQYHRMIETGILPEGQPIELLDGYLVRKDRSQKGTDPMTVGHEHALTIDILTELLASVRQHGFYPRAQLPITLPPDNEPEPDVAIVRGVPRDYRGRHPGPADVAAVIEVADSSLAHDRTTKHRIYAAAGVGQYLIINLPDRQIEDHRQPQPATGRYTLVRTLRRHENVQVALTPNQSIELPAADILP